MKNIHIPISWDYNATIPFDEIADRLSEEDYNKYKNQYLSFDVILTYENHTGDKETGMEPSFEFDDWRCSSTIYPAPIIKALHAYLSTEPKSYSEKAYEKMCDFIDYQKYGEY